MVYVATGPCSLWIYSCDYQLQASQATISVEVIVLDVKSVLINFSH